MITNCLQTGWIQMCFLATGQESHAQETGWLPSISQISLSQAKFHKMYWVSSTKKPLKSIELLLLSSSSSSYYIHSSPTPLFAKLGPFQVPNAMSNLKSLSHGFLAFKILIKTNNVFICFSDHPIFKSLRNLLETKNCILRFKWSKLLFIFSDHHPIFELKQFVSNKLHLWGLIKTCLHIFRSSHL